jgi:hypothetical protein
VEDTDFSGKADLQFREHASFYYHLHVQAKKHDQLVQAPPMIVAQLA